MLVPDLAKRPTGVASLLSPARPLDDCEGLVDLVSGNFQVRSLNVWVSQHAISVEAVTVSNVERPPGSFQVIRRVFRGSVFGDEHGCSHYASKTRSTVA